MAIKLLINGGITSEQTPDLCTTTSALTKSLVKNISYKETCMPFIIGLQAYGKQQPEIALGLMKTAAEKNNHPAACIDFALSHLIKKDYIASQNYLYKSLLYGLEPGMYGIEAGKFCNKRFLRYARYYLIELLKPQYPSTSKQLLLSTCKEMLEVNNVNIDDFCTLFYEKTGHNLSAVPEWNAVREQ